MFRRLPTLLAALGYLAGQLAAVPHAHGREAAHEHHSDHPHVHLSGTHAHGEHDHHHDDADDRDHGAANDCQRGHDADAVYLQPVVADAANSGSGQGDLLKPLSPGTWLPPAITTPPIAGVLSFGWFERNPDLTGGRCALFLALQTLRI
jgi:hypothetical protein